MAGNGAVGSAMPSMSSNSSTSSGSASGIPSRTRSRAVCSSRPSTPVAARSRRATAWKGTWLVCDSQNAVNTSTCTGACHRRNFTHQTAFAYARRADHADHSAVPVDCTVQQAFDGGHLPPPTDQIGLSAADGVMLIAHAQQAAGGDWFFGALDPNRLRLAESCCAFNQSCGGRAEHHPARRSDRLHPLSHTHLLTDGGVTQRRPNRSRRRSPDRSSGRRATADRHRRGR